MIVAFLPSWLWRPLAEGSGSTCSTVNHTGCGYAFWSGVGSDIGEITLVTALVATMLGLYRHHNCHVAGCHAVGHIDPNVAAPACRKHHSLGHLHGVSHGRTTT